MEVSSQGLQYDRVYGTVFSTGVFLNIGEDHISPIEHRDFDEYFSAKNGFSHIRTTRLSTRTTAAQTKL